MAALELELDYDRLAAEYARHRRVHPGVLGRLVAGAGLTAASRVLEVGCGTGNHAAALVGAVGCACVGVDPSAAMLARARARPDPVAVARARAERLPCADGAFDLVYSVDVIHHVRDRAAHVAEAYRVLAPGGWVCTVTDSAADIRRRRPLSSHFPETVAVELDRYPPTDVLRVELAAAGFAEVGEEGVELAYALTDLQPYRDRVFSSLHLIPDEAYRRGLTRLEADLAAGPVPALSVYTLVWGRKGWGRETCQSPGSGGHLQSVVHRS
jgi:ubiquinone/menaquinone biosynthesis C-methylase UbiE